MLASNTGAKFVRLWREKWIESYVIRNLREALLLIHRSCLSSSCINTAVQFGRNCLIRSQGTFTHGFIQGMEIRKKAF